MLGSVQRAPCSKSRELRKPTMAPALESSRMPSFGEARGQLCPPYVIIGRGSSAIIPAGSLRESSFTTTPCVYPVRH